MIFSCVFIWALVGKTALQQEAKNLMVTSIFGVPQSVPRDHFRTVLALVACFLEAFYGLSAVVLSYVTVSELTLVAFSFGLYPLLP